MRTTWNKVRSAIGLHRLPVTLSLLCAGALTVLASCGGGGSGSSGGFAPTSLAAPDPAAAAAATKTTGSWPAAPTAQVCGNAAILDGPATPPPGAIVVPVGNNEAVFIGGAPGKTYWFAPGVHYLGTDLMSQIIPADDTTYIGAPGAILDGQRKNAYAFTQHAKNVTIKHLTIRNFGTGKSNNDEGVVNHNAGENWTITNNTVIHNDGAGVFIGSGNLIANNCLKENGQYGFSSYAPEGISNVTVTGNEIVGNNTDDWETLRDGCGCTGGGKFWETHGGTVTNNWVHDNRGPGIWADNNNSGFLIEGNTIEDNDGTGVFYEVSYNFMIRNNTFKRNAIKQGKVVADAGDSFPNAAIYVSESGGDARAGSLYAQSEITGNYFENNWDGIALWENADRFCRPDEEFDTTNGCPFFDRTWGTRYKTQNIAIHDNEFHFDKAAVNCINNFCGRMALFSNWGSWPKTSPYKGTVIQEAITFRQNNKWTNNKYVGPWRFLPYEANRDITFAAWQASPYLQDAGSTKQ